VGEKNLKDKGLEPKEYRQPSYRDGFWVCLVAVMIPAFFVFVIFVLTNYGGE
jgi:hypothetical protein